MFTIFWGNDISILYNRNHILEIFPAKDYDIIRKLNAILRFSIYYSVLVFLYNKKNTNVFYIPVVVGIITYIVYQKNKTIQVDNALIKSINGDPESVGDLQQSCRIPTKDNPFMNPELSDLEIMWRLKKRVLPLTTRESRKKLMNTLKMQCRHLSWKKLYAFALKNIKSFLR